MPRGAGADQDEYGPWRRFFQNDVQYVNRVQRPEWSRLFAGAGLEPVLEQPIPDGFTPVEVHPCHATLSPEDQACVVAAAIQAKY